MKIVQGMALVSVFLVAFHCTTDNSVLFSQVLMTRFECSQLKPESQNCTHTGKLIIPNCLDLGTRKLVRVEVDSLLFQIDARGANYALLKSNVLSFRSQTTILFIHTIPDLIVQTVYN
jgi:hypothetical protein